MVLGGLAEDQDLGKIAVALQSPPKGLSPLIFISYVVGEPGLKSRVTKMDGVSLRGISIHSLLGSHTLPQTPDWPELNSGLALSSQQFFCLSRSAGITGVSQHS